VPTRRGWSSHAEIKGRVDAAAGNAKGKGRHQIKGNMQLRPFPSVYGSNQFGMGLGDMVVSNSGRRALRESRAQKKKRG